MNFRKFGFVWIGAFLFLFRHIFFKKKLVQFLNLGVNKRFVARNEKKKIKTALTKLNLNLVVLKFHL